MTTEQIDIQCYGFEDFLKQVQEGVVKGYLLDFETVEGYPRFYYGSNVYTARLVKSKEEVKVENTLVEQQQEKSEAVGKEEPKPKPRGKMLKV